MLDQPYQRTLIMLKPDTVRRGLIGEIIGRIEAKGLNIVALKMFRFTQPLTDQFYAEHVDREYYRRLSEFVKSARISGSKR